MNTKDHVMIIAAWSLVAVIIGMLLMFAYAVIDPNFDSDKIFQIIGPAFQTVIGGFIGLITGLKVGSDDDNK